MQSIATMNEQVTDYLKRSRALNTAAKRLAQRLIGGCWQHDLSRPFTHRGRTYRVCVKCGLARDFSLTAWKTHGASYALPSCLS